MLVGERAIVAGSLRLDKSGFGVAGFKRLLCEFRVHHYRGLCYIDRLTTLGSFGTHCLSSSAVSEIVLGFQSPRGALALRSEMP